MQTDPFGVNIRQLWGSYDTQKSTRPVGIRPPPQTARSLSLPRPSSLHTQRNTATAFISHAATVPPPPSADTAPRSAAAAVITAAARDAPHD